MTETANQLTHRVIRRRWPRFGIRFLMLVVTLSAIWLAVSSNRARSQKKAVNQVEQLGGQLAFDYQFDANMNWKRDPKLPAPVWLIDLVGEDYARTVNIVNFDVGSDPTNDDLAIVERFSDLKQLSLANRTKISDDGLRHLAGMYDLEVLVLSGTNVEGEGLRHLRHCQSITGLTLDRTPLTDEGLKHVARLANLQWLHLSGTHITDQGLLHLASLGKLEYLELRGTAVTDEGLKHLFELKSLKHVDLGGTKVTSAGRKLLRAKLPNCTFQ